MGVRGLTTYINYNQNAVLKQFYLHDSNLVIDGHSLSAQLYLSTNSFSAFGGDYDKYAIQVKNFFKSLRKCNVTPYVLFDGSHESRKLRTIYSRLRSKINGASRLDPVTQGSLRVFPLLLRMVFIEVLNELNIPYTVCEFEADDEIASMARHLNCPVLSYDSDFFIYNVLYIPFNTLERNIQFYEENGNKIFYLECKLFKIENLTEHFGGLNKEMMPLLATLLGNDYVEKRVFSKFFSQLKLPKSKRQNEQQRCINGLFKWLQNETFDLAVAKILGRLKKNQKDKVFAVIKKSVAAYNSTHCESLKYFNIESKKSNEEVELQMPDTNEEEECSSDSSVQEESSDESDSEDVESKDMQLRLPEWCSNGIRQNYIPKEYINLYTHHLFICNPQAEDYSDEDSCFCALSIIRYAFDILTDFAHENCTYVSREKDCNYKRLLLGTEYSIPRALDKPYKDLTVEELYLYFYKFLEIKLEYLNLTELQPLPANFELFMIAILWWVKFCSVPLNHVHSLFICYIMLEVIDEKTGTFRGQYNFNNKYGKKVEEIRKRPISNSEQTVSEPFLKKNKVLYEDCLLAASSLLKHFEIDDSIRKKPRSYDVKRMHAFAQFQCCLMHLNSLNTLCREPFQATKFSKCFNGTFVYNVALKLENQRDPIKFLEQYLNGAKTVVMFYKSLWKIYENCTKEMGISTITALGKKQRRGRRKKRNDNDDIDFIVKGFKSEVVI